MRMNAPHGAKVRALLIDPFMQQVSELFLCRTTDAGLFAAMRRWVDCELLEPIHISADDTMWVDEEGLFRDRDCVEWFRWSTSCCGSLRPIAGRALILGSDRGYVTSTRMPLLDAAGSARFLSRETAQHMLMHHARMVTK